MRRQRHLLLAVLCVFLAAAIATGSGRPQLVVTAAFAEGEYIFLEGRNFLWSGDEEVVVTLAEEGLEVAAVTETALSALLPQDLAPGSYEVRLSRGPAPTQTDVFDVTVGAVGPQGPEGPEGPAGPQGLEGATGPEGQQGPPGLSGAQGPQGDPGPPGSEGPQGEQGPKGDTGDVGPQGPEGPQGAIGPQGEQGSAGPQGDQGATGATGAVGPTGPQGPQGPAGASLSSVEDLDGIPCGEGGVGVLRVTVGGALAGQVELSCVGAPYNRRVFVTSTSYQSDLINHLPPAPVGIDRHIANRAAAECQRLAQQAGLEGTFEAWIGADHSVALDSPALRFTRSPDPYVLVNGTIVANNWQDLTDGTIAHPIDVDENGETVPPSNVWTDTFPDGTSAEGATGGACDRWKQTGDDGFWVGLGWVGVTTAADHTWASPFDPENPVPPADTFCHGYGRLYCFQQ